jgi:hypothetical protein
MEEDRGILRVLKWAGVIALIAVPVYLVLKNRRPEDAVNADDDDSNIFAAELEE